MVIEIIKRQLIRKNRRWENFVYNIEKAIRIRTNEEDEKAI